MKRPRHFLDLDRLDSVTLRHILHDAAALKAARAEGEVHQPLAGRTLAMIFEKPSTRTRVSFDIGMRQLGGNTVVLSPQDMQIGRGETIADTARVLSRYVDAILIRCLRHSTMLELVDHAAVPVINGLTDVSHPCQVMADVMTFEEHRGPIAGSVVAWLGDGNNVATSWIHAAARFGFELRLACPDALRPSDALLDWAAGCGGKVRCSEDVGDAVAGADCVVTDTWVSMGTEDGSGRRRLLTPFRVDAAAMAMAKRDAIFMHCLPARRGEEVTAEVIDGPQSVVWDEAENRLHAQKGILNWCLS